MDGTELQSQNMYCHEIRVLFPHSMSQNEGTGFLTNLLMCVKVTRSYMQARALVTEET